MEFEDCVEIFKEMTEKYESFLNASTIEIQERANAALQTIKILEKLKATAVLKELFEGEKWILWASFLIDVIFLKFSFRWPETGWCESSEKSSDAKWSRFGWLDSSTGKAQNYFFKFRKDSNWVKFVQDDEFELLFHICRHS